MSKIKVLSIENQAAVCRLLDSALTEDKYELTFMYNDYNQFKHDKTKPINIESITIPINDIIKKIKRYDYDVILINLFLAEESPYFTETKPLGYKIINFINQEKRQIGKVVLTGDIDKEEELRKDYFIDKIIIKSSIDTDVLERFIKEESIANKGKIFNGNFLFLSANPKETKKLELKREFEEISNIISSQFELSSESNLTLFSLQKLILDHNPKIIHISCHGQYGNFETEKKAADSGIDMEKNDGLILEDYQGNKVIVPAEKLEELFELLTKKVKIELVFFNACFSENQAEAISKYVPYVIGMEKAIKDTVAIEFSKVFYYHLTRNSTIEEAFNHAQVTTKKPSTLSNKGIAVLKKKDNKNE